MKNILFKQRVKYNRLVLIFLLFLELMRKQLSFLELTCTEGWTGGSGPQRLWDAPRGSHDAVPPPFFYCWDYRPALPTLTWFNRDRRAAKCLRPTMHCRMWSQIPRTSPWRCYHIYFNFCFYPKNLKENESMWEDQCLTISFRRERRSGTQPAQVWRW